MVGEIIPESRATSVGISKGRRDRDKRLHLMAAVTDDVHY